MSIKEHINFKPDFPNEPKAPLTRKQWYIAYFMVKYGQQNLHQPSLTQLGEYISATYQTAYRYIVLIARKKWLVMQDKTRKGLWFHPLLLDMCKPGPKALELKQQWVKGYNGVDVLPTNEIAKFEILEGFDE